MHSIRLKLTALASYITVICGAQVALASNPNQTFTYQSVSSVSMNLGFAGLSMEKDLMNSQWYAGIINPNNTSLINMIKKIGVTSLRLGGSTGDNPNSIGTLPAAADENNVAQFATKAGIDQLVYALGMGGNFNVTLASQDAQTMWVDLANANFPNRAIFELGNEPDHYSPKDFNTYITNAQAYINAIHTWDSYTTFQVAPDAASDSNWVTGVSALTPSVRWETIHYYPGGSPSSCSVNGLLGIQHAQYYTWIAPYGSYSTVISETNSCWGGGKNGVSNTFAATIWALDYMHWMAKNGILSINMHSGSYNPNSYDVLLMKATSTVATPLAHAVAAYNAIFPDSGTYVNSTASGPSIDTNINIYSWKEITNPNNFDVILINRYPTRASDTNAITSLDLKSYGSFTHAKGIWLDADSVTAMEDPNNLSNPQYGFEQPIPTTGNPNVATRVTLNTGTPALSTFPLSNPNTVTVTLPAYSALLLHFTP